MVLSANLNVFELLTVFEIFCVRFLAHLTTLLKLLVTELKNNAVWLGNENWNKFFIRKLLYSINFEKQKLNKWIFFNVLEFC